MKITWNNTKHNEIQQNTTSKLMKSSKYNKKYVPGKGFDLKTIVDSLMLVSYGILNHRVYWPKGRFSSMVFWTPYPWYVESPLLVTEIWPCGQNTLGSKYHILWSIFQGFKIPYDTGIGRPIMIPPFFIYKLIPCCLHAYSLPI
jgi:hypothetical protein